MKHTPMQHAKVLIRNNAAIDIADLILQRAALLEACKQAHNVLKGFIEYANETQEIMVSKGMQTAFLTTGDAIETFSSLFLGTHSATDA